MPKKTNALQNFYVYSPDPEHGMDPSKIIHFQNLRNLESIGYVYRMIDQLCPVDCSAFFSRHRPLRPPLFIVGDEFAHRKGPQVDRWCGYANHVHEVRTQEEADAIEAALDEDVPYKWHTREVIFLVKINADEKIPFKVYEKATDVFLFGTCLWRCTAAENLLESDQLRLFFLEAVDKERRKLERLKRKFSGPAEK